MKKLCMALTALLVVLSLMLSGCNLIGLDPIAQIAEIRAEIDTEYQVVLADYDGGSVVVGDVLFEFTNEYNYYLQLGLTAGADLAELVKQGCVDRTLERVAQKKEADKRGVALTAEEMAEIEATVQGYYDESHEQYVENMDGETKKIRTAQAELELFAQGYTYDILVELEVSQMIEENLRELLDVEVGEISDDALQAVYDTRIEEDENYYGSYLDAFESDMTSDEQLITWMPAGYRTVKHILLIPDEAVLTPATEKADQIAAFETELDSLNDDLATALDDDGAQGNPEDIRQQILAVEASAQSAKAELPALQAACLNSVQDKINDIQTRLAAGEDFMTLVDEYGEDPGMENEPTRTRGYYVSADSAIWDPVFKNASMLLENIGDISEPVIGQSGIHIIRYESDVTPGAVPLEELRDVLTEEAVETQKETHYAEELAAWVAALNPVYHYENWNPVE